MNYLCALLLLIMEEEEAFWVMSVLVRLRKGNTLEYRSPTNEAMPDIASCFLVDRGHHSTELLHASNALKV